MPHLFGRVLFWGRCYNTSAVRPQVPSRLRAPLAQAQGHVPHLSTGVRVRALGLTLWLFNDVRRLMGLLTSTRTSQPSVTTPANGVLMSGFHALAQKQVPLCGSPCACLKALEEGSSDAHVHVSYFGREEDDYICPAR